MTLNKLVIFCTADHQNPGQRLWHVVCRPCDRDGNVWCEYESPKWRHCVMWAEVHISWHKRQAPSVVRAAWQRLNTKPRDITDVILAMEPDENEQQQFRG